MPVMSVRLPVLATVKAAYQDVFADFPATLRALSLMFVLLILFTEVPFLFLAGYVDKGVKTGMDGMQALISGSMEGGASDASGFDSKLFVAAAAVSIYTLQMILLFRFMQGWYRQWLLGEDKGKVIGLRLGRGEWQLMIASVKAGLVFAPFILAGMMVIAAAYPNSDFKTAPAFDFWPYLFALLGMVLYVQARVALAYPITAMVNDSTSCVRQSWRLTRYQGSRIVIGNLLLVVPLLTLAYGVFWLISMLIGLVLPESVMIKNGGALDLSLQLLFKVLSEFCILVFMAGLSAYHARCYAYLVRSSSSSSVH